MLEYYRTLVGLRAHEGHPYLALTDELWVSFLCHVERSDREISGAVCIVVYIVVHCVWCFLRRRGLMYNRYQCRSRDSAWLLVFRSRDICWYRMDIDHWMLVQVETMCIQWETMTPDLSVWIHDIASNASPHTPCVMLRRFVVPEIAQNCKWFCSLFEVIWLLLLLSIGCCL